MKIRSIFDLHGRNIWQKAIEDIDGIDKIIFHGDYVDSFTLSNDHILENLQDIIIFKKENPDLVELLLGNHDLSYLHAWLAGQCSGFRSEAFPTLHQLFQDNKHLFQAAYQHENYLFTHAGVSQWWNDNILIPLSKFDMFEGMDKGELLNAMLQSRYMEKLVDVGWRRGGDKNTGGPLWCDKKELKGSPLENFNQVVGHTQIDKIIKFKHKSGTIWFGDCNNVGEYFLDLDI